MEDMIFNNNCNVTKEEQLQNFFNAFDSDRVEELINVNVNIFLYKKWKIIMYNN